MLARQCNAALRWVALPSPLMHEYRRSPPRHSDGPIPVCQQNDIIQRVGSLQALMAFRVRCAHQMIVVGCAARIRPEVAGPYRPRPACRSREPVGSVEYANDMVHANRCRTVALALGARDAAATFDTRKQTASKPDPTGCEHEIVKPFSELGRHCGARAQSKCPDFAAFVSR